MSLNYGKIRVKVSPHAKGFSVNTLHYDIVDIGTEFGLDINDDLNELHVFNGEVHIQNLGSIIKILKQNDAVSWTQDHAIRQTLVNSDRFVSAEKLNQMEADWTKKLHQKVK